MADFAQNPLAYDLSEMVPDEDMRYMAQDCESGFLTNGKLSVNIHPDLLSSIQKEPSHNLLHST